MAGIAGVLACQLLGMVLSTGEFQIPNTLQQAQAYLALKAGVMMPADIVLIFIGTNDYMVSGQDVSAASALAKDGA